MSELAAAGNLRLRAGMMDVESIALMSALFGREQESIKPPSLAFKASNGGGVVNRIGSREMLLMAGKSSLT